MYRSILLRCPLALAAALLGASAFALPESTRTEREPAPSADRIERTLQIASAQVETRIAELGEPSERSDALGGLGMLYHAQNRLAEAAQHYSDALAEQDTIHWHYLLGVVLADQGDVEAASREFRSALALAEGRHPLASYRLGRALLAQGDHSGAADVLRDAQGDAPESAAVLTALADAELGAGNVRQASALLERAAALEPEAGQIAYKLALSYRQLGHVERAQTWLRRRNDLAPAIDDPLLVEVAALTLSPKFFVDAGNRAWQRGEHDEAAAAWRRATELAPDEAEPGLVLAHALGTLGRIEEATAEVRRVVAAHPSSARAWYLLAWIAQDSVQTAREATDRSLTLAEDDAARALSAALWMAQRRFAAAADDYQALVARQPDNAYYRYWLAMAYFGAGHCEAARPIMAEALRLQSNWGQAHIALMRADALCGDPSIRRAAHAKARQFVEIENGPDTWITLAWTALAVGRTAEARSIIDDQLPHPDAAMLEAAIAAHGDRAINALARPFAQASDWWRPAELRPPAARQPPMR